MQRRDPHGTCVSSLSLNIEHRIPNGLRSGSRFEQPRGELSLALTNSCFFSEHSAGTAQLERYGLRIGSGFECVVAGVAML